jgi:NAD(P)H-hydrate epimerase
VVSVAEMQAADRRALERVDEATLVLRAGTAVFHAARRMLGDPYGRRVVVVAGRGNNGADGRVAASLLRRRGAGVRVLDPPSGDDALVLPPCHLVIDAAYGTGFHGTYRAPGVPHGTPVLAVDIPSGVSGDTGEADTGAVHADRTVTMAAWKLGLLQGAGPAHRGVVEVADIGIDVGAPAIHLMEDGDRALLPARPRVSHKWDSAVAVVAGSPGMEGAAALSARGASRAGAGMVRLCVPGGDGESGRRPGPWPLEAVRVSLPAEWTGAMLAVLERCGALVIGPGLGRDEGTVAAVRAVVARAPVPVVADADALFALGDAAAAADVIRAGGRPVILTPHDGEYRRLAGSAPGEDRVSAARRLAEQTGAVVLLKGPLTAVAAPGDATGSGGAVLLAAAGTPGLATAGTGDVLSGVIGGFVARGLAPLEAAALAAHVHGRASALGFREGLVAGDLPDLVARWLSTSGAVR